MESKNIRKYTCAFWPTTFVHVRWFRTYISMAAFCLMCNLRRCIATKRIKCSIWNKLKQHLLDVQYILRCVALCWAEKKWETSAYKKNDAAIQVSNKRTNEPMKWLSEKQCMNFALHISIFIHTAEIVINVKIFYIQNDQNTGNRHSLSLTKCSTHIERESNSMNSSIINAMQSTLHDK